MLKRDDAAQWTRAFPHDDLATNPPPPDFLGSWRWRDPAPGETLRAWISRQDRQKAELKARSSHWLRKGRKVRVIHDPFPTGLGGRAGLIVTLCGEEFADYVYVRLTPIEGESEAPIHMIGLECLEPT